MKTRQAFLIAALMLFMSAVITFAGCSAAQVQQAADRVQFDSGGESPAGSAMTQPSAFDQGAHSTAQIVAAVMPAAGSILSLVALAAGVVGTIAGNVAGKKTGVKSVASALTEVVSDVAAFKDPTTPWTDKTRKLLTDLGHTDAAS